MSVPSTPRRVKVYENRDADWLDRGTGHCVGHLEQDEAHLVVRSEEDQSIILQTRINSEDVYSKPQDTIIQWTQAVGEDMALSFEKAEGCDEIWDFISSVQKQYHIDMPPGLDDLLSDDGDAVGPLPISLPTPELGNLAAIENIIMHTANNPRLRDHLARWEYVEKLIPLLEISEDLENLQDLHRLCNIMKSIILINDASILDYIMREDIILGVAGILEYDPDFPAFKANHRIYLSDPKRFRQVVRIQNPEIQRKIHQTFRLQYFKDVILARMLDDPTFNILNSLIFFNYVDIMQHIQSNKEFLNELFSIFDCNDRTRKALAIQFIHQFFNVAKNLQNSPRSILHNTFISHGLLRAIEFALQDSSSKCRVQGIEIAMSTVEHDPTVIRQSILSQSEATLLDSLTRVFISEKDLGVKSQIADTIKVLCDPAVGPPSDESVTKQTEFMTRARQEDPAADKFLDFFYAHSMANLIAPFNDLQDNEHATVDKAALLSHICDLVCFFIRAHSFRSKSFILESGLSAKIVKLFGYSQKHLHLAAIRFFRVSIGMKDEFYNRHFMKLELFSPILRCFEKSKRRNNLITSACLELFDIIRRDNIKSLVNHLVDMYKERLIALKDFQPFQLLLDKYEQYHDESIAKATEQPKSSSDNWRFKDPDTEEDQYFATSDEEEKTHLDHGQPPTNGTPLVDYPDESIEVPPPVSEKRRRDDDEDDGLLHLSTKKDQTQSPDKHPPKKIAISIGKGLKRFSKTR